MTWFIRTGYSVINHSRSHCRHGYLHLSLVWCPQDHPTPSWGQGTSVRLRGDDSDDFLLWGGREEPLEVGGRLKMSLTLHPHSLSDRSIWERGQVEVEDLETVSPFAKLSKESPPLQAGIAKTPFKDPISSSIFTAEERKLRTVK